MRATLILVFLAVGIAVASAAITCMGDKSKCAEDECCVKVGPVGRCKKLNAQDKRCELRQSTMLTKKHVYLVMCPCATGLKCLPKTGLKGKVLGTCRTEGDEPEPEY